MHRLRWSALQQRALIITLGFLLVPFTIQATGNVEIFAVVNGQKIPMTLYQASLKFQILSKAMFHGDNLSKQSTVRFEEKTQTLLITRALIIQEANRVGIIPSDEEIQAYLESNTHKYGDKKVFIKLLEDNGIPLEDYQRMISDIYRVHYYVENHLMNELEITERQCRDYYQENIRTYQPTHQVVVSVFTIPAAFPESEDVLLTRDLKDEDGVQDFGFLKGRIAGITQVHQTRAHRKDAIFLSKEETPTMWEIALDLEPGSVRYLGKKNGQHSMIYLHRKDMAKQLTFEESRAEIEDILSKRALKDLVSQKIKGLRESADIKIIYKKPGGQ